MTGRQQRFVEEFPKDRNGTQAAIRAGFSPKTAAQIASRLLRDVKIGAAIAERTAVVSEKAGLSHEWVIARLRENYDRAMEAVAETDRKGIPTGRFVYDGQVANRALELIGKHLGTFPDRLIVDDPAKLSDEQLQEKVEEAGRRLKLA